MFQVTKLHYHQQSKILDVYFDDGLCASFSPEFLRVLSPSAEVRGHGGGEGILQLNKQNVSIKAVEPTGNYAVRLIFDDGHDSGLYTWGYLHDLGLNQRARWARYVERCAAAGHPR